MRTYGRTWSLLGLALAAACNGKPIEEGDPVLTVTPELLDFGVVPMGSEATLEVTLTNSGGGTVEILSVTLTEGDTDVWTVDRGEVGSIGAGSSAVVSVTLEPEDVEPYTGQVQIRTDYAEQGSWLVSLTGAGGVADVDYDGDGVSQAEGDCDDGNPDVYPGADEGCDGRDTDCNGIAGPGEVDADYDGSLVCEGDCDDQDGSRSPDFDEECDGGVDNDCDPSTLEDEDADVDGYTLCEGDCDDDAVNVNPSRPEICDGADNDCDGGSDNLDLDGDGHSQCSATGDCDDGDPNAYPVVVSTAGSPYGTGTDADPYDTLANGLANLDTVCRQVVLEAGTYPDNAHTWTTGSVTISGRTGDPADVVLEAAAYSRLFDISGGTVVLQDLTLTGGDAAVDGGAVRLVAATLEADHVVFRGNASSADGGAIAMRATSTLTLRGGTEFDGNSAAGLGGALLSENSTLDDRGSRWTNNSAGTRGGALDRTGGTASIDGSEFTNNTAPEGGALAASGAGQFDLEGCWFALNTATGDGGAITFRDLNDGSGAVRNNRIQDNSAANGGGVAILGNLATVTVSNNTLTGNTSSAEGSGFYVGTLATPGVELVANVLHSNDGLSAIYVVPGSGALVSYDTAYLTNSGVHFAGEAGDGTGAPIDPTNFVRDPLLVAMSDDDDPYNDDLELGPGSLEVDSGPPFALFTDVDGSQNDRGFTGGPAAP